MEECLAPLLPGVDLGAAAARRREGEGEEENAGGNAEGSGSGASAWLAGNLLVFRLLD